MTMSTDVRAGIGNGPRGIFLSYDKDNPIDPQSPWKLTLVGCQNPTPTLMMDWFATDRLREFAHNILHILDQPMPGNNYAGGTVVELDNEGNPLVEFPNKERKWVTTNDFKAGDRVCRKDGKTGFGVDKIPVATVSDVTKKNNITGETQVWFEETGTWLSPEELIHAD